MEFSQISMSHPAVKDVLAIQNNTAPNRFGLLVAEGLWAAKVALDTGLRIDTFYWCPEHAQSDEAGKRAAGSLLPVGFETQWFVRFLRWPEKSYIEYVAPSGFTDGMMKMSRLST